LLPHVFDLFIQGKRRLDRSEGGLGLGLTLVKKLIDLHGGQIAAYSQGVSQGSEFVVQLPLFVEVTPQMELLTPQGLNRETDQGLRILVIDDNQDVVDSISLWCQMSGHQVNSANNGEQGLAAASDFEPDVIILDIGLPDMEGYQVARKLREQPANQRTLIIALSGYMPSKTGLRTEKAGFDHYLIKPPNLIQLGDLLADYRSSNRFCRKAFQNQK
jgi:CheY-like chemotaxis protein